jgi:hypothetical protein
MRHSVLAKMRDGPEKDAMVQTEHEKASMRTKVEHQFHIVKNLFEFRKVRYRGISKNRSLPSMLFASATLVLYVRQAPAQPAPCGPMRLYALVSREPLKQSVPTERSYSFLPIEPLKKTITADSFHDLFPCALQVPIFAE